MKTCFQRLIKISLRPWYLPKRHIRTTSSIRFFEDPLSHPDLPQSALDEIQKHKDLLKNYNMHRIGSDHSVLVIVPELNSKINNNQSPDIQEPIGLVRTLEWKISGVLVLGEQSLLRETLLTNENMKKVFKFFSNASDNVSLIFVNIEKLTPPQRSYLEELLGLPVIDRYTIVLQIFHRHARTKEAKLQVALAQIPYLKYRLNGDRLIESDRKYEKNRLGESYYEKQVQLLKKREKMIKSKIAELKSNRALLRKSRIKEGVPTVAVVGYTNAGKTSLIKALTGRLKLNPEDKLFATLDVTVHPGHFKNTNLKVLFIDTVGFISNIPVGLVASFSSTLEDFLLADVIIHVRDLSHPNSEKQNLHILETMQRLFKKPYSQLEDKIITVGNKVDKVSKEIILNLPKVILPISSTEKYGLKVLTNMLESKIMTLTSRKWRSLRINNDGGEEEWIRKNFSPSKIYADPEDSNFLIVEVVLRDLDVERFYKVFSQ